MTSVVLNEFLFEDFYLFIYLRRNLGLEGINYSRRKIADLESKNFLCFTHKFSGDPFDESPNFFEGVFMDCSETISDDFETNYHSKLSEFTLSGSQNLLFGVFGFLPASPVRLRADIRFFEINFNAVELFG